MESRELQPPVTRRPLPRRACRRPLPEDAAWTARIGSRKAHVTLPFGLGVGRKAQGAETPR